MGYQVTAPLVIARDDSGHSHHFYVDELLPDNILKEDVKRFLADGMIAKQDAAPVPDSAPSDEPPAKSANKPEWEAFARSKGATDADLDGKSKEDLIATYGA